MMCTSHSVIDDQKHKKNLKPCCDVRNRQTSDVVRQTDVRQADVIRASSLNAPYPRGGGIVRNPFNL